GIPRLWIGIASYLLGACHLLPSGTTYERAADQIEPPPKEPSASGRFGAACLPSKSLPKLSRGQSRSALSLNSPRAPSSHSSASATVRAPPYRRLRHSVVPVAAKLLQPGLLCVNSLT